MTLRAIELARDAAHPLGLLLKFPLLFGVLLLVALSAAEDPHRDGPSYFFEANVVLPKNVSLTGAVGAKCVDTLQSWSSPAEVNSPFNTAPHSLSLSMRLDMSVTGLADVEPACCEAGHYPWRIPSTQHGRTLQCRYHQSQGGFQPKLH